MRALGLVSNNDEFTISNYLEIIRKKVDLKLSNREFVGHLAFEINIKDGQVCNMNISYKESVKI